MCASHGNMYLMNQAALSNALRRVWVDYVSWTTALIYTILFGTHDQDAIEARLKQNAHEYAGIFAQFYGDEAGMELLELFEQVQGEMTDLIQAYQQNDMESVAEHRNTLYSVGYELAGLMARLNPYWDEASIQIGMNEMINLFEDEIMHIIRQEFDKSIEAYDDLLNQAYQISDTLLFGLQRQFRQ